MDIVIREARVCDLDRLMTIEDATFPPKEAAERTTFEYRIKNLKEWFLVAERNGLVIGLINGRTTNIDVIQDELYDPINLPDGEYFALLCVETEPQWQRMGVAETLIKFITNKAREKNLKGVILACKDTLIPYYEKFGFEHVGISASMHGGAIWNDMRLTF